MGKFTDTPREKSTINNYIDSWVNGISDYSKFFEQAPNFCTYYSKDQLNSTENGGLGNVMEIVGNESPLKYNRINNMPIFGADEITPSNNSLRLEGIDIDSVSSTAVILPGTIEPQPDDLLVFSYHEHGQGLNFCFRVSDANQNIISSNVYFEITFDITPFDIGILNSRQVTNEYYVVYENIGTSHQAVILEKEFKVLQKLEELRDTLEETYIEDYYNTRLNSFICEDDQGFIYDPYLHEFIKNNKLFIQSRRTMKNLYIENNLPITRKDYVSSIYNSVESNSYTLLPNAYSKVSVSPVGMFTSFPYRISKLIYGPINPDKDINSLEPIYHSIFDRNLNTILKDYENINSLGDNLDPYELIFIYYNKDKNKINSDFVGELKEHYFNNIDNSLQNYILTPIVLFIISQIMDDIIDNS